jgi:penicillin G amidase
MAMADQERLRELGNGKSIASLCAADGLTRSDFDAWWERQIKRCAVPASGSFSIDVSAEVQIQRDPNGIPHIFAENDRDLFFGFGFAMAEDRLFQLDWLRRKGLGRLSEIIGEDGVELDTIARTVGLNRIAEAEWSRLSPEVQSTLEAFSDGVNALIESRSDNLPIEFALLDYKPEPWSPVDSLAIECEFRWYLTGRFPVICMPEIAKRKLGEGPLYEAWLLSEIDDESILHPGDYEASAELPFEPVGESVADPDASTGSNNWVVAGRKTATGAPLLASDPHIAFEAVSCWYEAHLCGGSFNVAGMAYAGMPAIMFGRTEKVAWGITNNICSQRDLYQERVSEDHPGCFEFDGEWQPARELTETISVRDGASIEKSIRFSKNGPIVDEILPAPANELGPVSLRWLGMSQGGWLTSLLSMDRASTVSEFREALRPWHVPTFALVIADVDGRIGFQASGRVPVRNRNERAFRRGWDPQDQWQGLIPFEEMPSLDDPERGWIASANNRVAPNDFPHRMYGCWVSGARAQRIREMFGDRESLTVDDMRDGHQDALNLRAAARVPELIAQLESEADERTETALAYLRNWDFVSTPEAVGPTIFNVFYTHWCQTLSRARFDGAAAELMSKGVEPSAGGLIAADLHGWFPDDDHAEKLRETFAGTLAFLEDRLGPDTSTWSWGRLHCMPLRHVLSSRGDLAELLDHGGSAVRGDMLTVCNTGGGPDWIAASGGGYRMIADLSSSPPVLRAVDGQSQSGHPGSPHYSDQFEDWAGGRYHEIPLTREFEGATTVSLFPAD